MRPGKSVLTAVLLAVVAAACGQDTGADQAGANGERVEDRADEAAEDAPDTGEEGEAEGGETLTGEFSPVEGQTDRDIAGEATLTRGADGTSVSVQVSGLEPDAAHPSHLHLGTCADMGPHYQDDPDGAEEPPNELWPSSDPEDPAAGLRADDTGEASGEGSAEWRARDSARAVFVHAPGEGKTAMIACADLR